MTYLYAGLGILMMSGIVAIFNMSLKITSQPIQAFFPENKYQKNKFDVKDKIFLELLQNASKDWGFGNNFCDKILSVINEPSTSEYKWASLSTWITGGILSSSVFCIFGSTPSTPSVNIQYIHIG